MARVHAVIMNASNGVDGWDRLVAILDDETTAGCCAIDLDERLARDTGGSFGESLSFSVRAFDLLKTYDIDALAAQLDD